MVFAGDFAFTLFRFAFAVAAYCSHLKSPSSKGFDIYLQGLLASTALQLPLQLSVASSSLLVTLRRPTDYIDLHLGPEHQLHVSHFSQFPHPHILARIDSVNLRFSVACNCHKDQSVS